MTDAQQRAAAKAFAKNWKDRGYEKGDSQIFWVELLTTVFGVPRYRSSYPLKIRYTLTIPVLSADISRKPM